MKLIHLDFRLSICFDFNHFCSTAKKQLFSGIFRNRCFTKSYEKITFLQIYLNDSIFLFTYMGLQKSQIVTAYETENASLEKHKWKLLYKTYPIKSTYTVRFQSEMDAVDLYQLMYLNKKLNSFVVLFVRRHLILSYAVENNHLLHYLSFKRFTTATPNF